MGYEGKVLAEADSLKSRRLLTAMTRSCCSNMGMPVHEGQTATALIKGAEIFAELKKLGLPVRCVFCLLFGVDIWLWCRQRPLVNFARRVARGLGYRRGCFHSLHRDRRFPMSIRINMDEVPYAITTKCHPVDGIYLVPHNWDFVLLPFLPPMKSGYRDAAGDFRLHLAQRLAAGDNPVKATFENLGPKRCRNECCGTGNPTGLERNESNTLDC